MNPIPAQDQVDVLCQPRALLDREFQLQGGCCQAQPVPAGNGVDFLRCAQLKAETSPQSLGATGRPQWFFRWTNIKAMAAGVTPGNLAAAPSVAG